MLSKLSKQIADLLKNNGIVNEEDIEIYQFGIYQSISFLINILTTAVILTIFDMYIGGLLFCLFYFLLRCYGGGYHAKSVLNCYILSALLIVIEMVLIRIIKGSVLIYIPFIISFMFVWKASPIDTYTKKLDRLEKKVYQGKTRNLLILSMITVFAFHILDFGSAVSVCMAVITEGIMQFIGSIDNKVKNERMDELNEIL